MRRQWVIPIILLGLLIVIVAVSQVLPVKANDLPAPVAQLPTVAVATVTGTPTGPMAVVVPGNEPQVNLRSGPGSLYDRVGVLLVGQRVPAKGRSPKGEWILVDYPGVPGGTAWVYALYVDIQPKTQLPIVEPPPTPTLAQTATIDPTLAARFIITTEPTRLPTFTAPPPLAIPTYVEAGSPALACIPMGFVILGLAALGVFFGIVAFSQWR
jgi:uncharacterized protein YraI